MKNKFLLTLSIFAITNATTAAQAACIPGALIRGTSATSVEPSYLQAMARALDEFGRTPGALDMNAAAGRLSIAVDEKQVFDVQPNSFKVEVEVRTSYARVTEDAGPKIRRAKFTFVTNPTCSELILIGESIEPAIPIGPADIDMTSATQIAFTEYMMDPNVIPQNRHSGGHRILIYPPQICPHGSEANVNIVRSHHLGSTVYRTSTFLTDILNRDISDSRIQSGRSLPELCK